jgi:hypothetical protein
MQSGMQSGMQSREQSRKNRSSRLMERPRLPRGVVALGFVSL